MPILYLKHTLTVTLRPGKVVPPGLHLTLQDSSSLVDDFSRLFSIFSMSQMVFIFNSVKEITLSFTKKNILQVVTNTPNSKLIR